jgi:hypothetical protein
MKRLAILSVAAAAFLLIAGNAFAQGTFTVPFPFKAGTTSLPKGDYTLVKNDDAHITLKQESTGKEFEIAFSKRLAQPNPPLSEPQLVFDEVGDFAPSYTEYITVYILAEVWQTGADGFLIHEMKGAHATKIVKAQKAK